MNKVDYGTKVLKKLFKDIEDMSEEELREKMVEADKQYKKISDRKRINKRDY
jgi:hypothetical protein